MATAPALEKAFPEPVTRYLEATESGAASPAHDSVILRWTVPVVLAACLFVFVLKYMDPIVAHWATGACGSEWAQSLRSEARILGGPWPTVIGALALWAAGRGLNLAKARRFAALMVAVLVVGTLGCHLVKMIVARPRPFMIAAPTPAGQGAWERRVDSRFHSFPSGDVTVAAGFAMVAFLLAGGGGGRYLLFLIPLASTAGRVCAARHYPSDCLAAIVLGILAAWVLWRIQERRLARRAPHSDVERRRGPDPLARPLVHLHSR
jgi:membrane-associated phospholipid phosphatase